jgi:Domain of unknown function (DUF4214)/FG-GAP-like repeat
MAFFEINDTIAQAALVGEGTYDVSGIGIDWYRINSYAPGQMSFTMAPLGSNNINLELYNSAGQVIAHNFDPNGPLSTETINWLTPGNETFYLRVYSAGNSGHINPHYQLTVDLPNEAWPQPAYESNDTPATAKPLTEGAFRISGRNQDWFSLTMDPGSATFSMTPGFGTDVNMVLYNSSMQVVAANLQPGSESFSYNVTLAGTYYLNLYASAHTSSFYDLAIDLPNFTPSPYEPNNSAATAATITPGAYHITGLGEDWYKVKLNPGMATLTLAPQGGVDANMVLYDASMNVLAANFQPGTETFQYFVSRTADYYVRVFPTATSSVTYDLTIQAPQKSWSVDLPLGPIRDASVVLYDIDDDGKEEIFVGTSKALDAAGNEIRPAGLACLEDDGTVKWIAYFPAMSTPDPVTGKLYNTTSVSTAPFFADLDGDTYMDIIVGVGGDAMSEFNTVGQPGDKGGVYALNRFGQIMWYRTTHDTIGGPTNSGDGKPDGVFGAPVVFDIDGDGQREVIFNSWDQSTYFLTGATGAIERDIHLADTIWSTPRIADLNGDGIFEVLVSADITQNADAGTLTGGIFHVIQSDGQQNLPGWNTPIGNSNYTMLRGKWEEQTLWSSPQTADLNGDGKLEVIYGTGNFFHDTRGSYIKVWNSDGSLLFKLDTIGRTMSTPLIVDLDGNGTKEIVAATLDGYVHAWSNTGQPIFTVRPTIFGGTPDNPIFSAPIAVDLTGDGKLEIVFAKGAQMVVLRHDGVQLSDSSIRQHIFETGKGSPAISDIDNDGKLDIVMGGATPAGNQATVFRWENPWQTGSIAEVSGKDQAHQDQTNIEKFVERFYQQTLGRASDPHGLNYWVESLATGIRAGADVAVGFIFSQEFLNRSVGNAQFVDILYHSFFNRAPDSGGYNNWLNALNTGASRMNVLNGFLYSTEFSNLSRTFNIRPTR